MSDPYSASKGPGHVTASGVPTDKVLVVVDCSKLKVNTQKISLSVSKYSKLSSVTSHIRKKFEVPPTETFVYSNGPHQLTGDHTIGVIHEKYKDGEGKLVLEAHPFDAWGGETGTY